MAGESTDVESVGAALRRIVARSSTLGERIKATGLEPEETDAAQVEQRWARWRAAVGGERELQRRLAWDGLDEPRARRALGAFRLHPTAPLPPWALLLVEVVTSSSTMSDCRCPNPVAPLPFEQVLSPFVRCARRGLPRASGWNRFGPAARAALDRQLLERLCTDAARVLWQELQAEITGRAEPLVVVACGPAPRQAHDALVARLRGAGLLALFEDYPSLARRLAMDCLLWQDAAAELVERLDADADQLVEAWGLARPVEAQDVTVPLSDPHRGMRSVAILTLADEQRIVYKPRSLAAEAGWNHLLADMRRRGVTDLRTFRVLNRDTHGWAEFVPSEACPNEDAARRYYQRAGALLAVVHVLGGTDCHGDNVVPAGEHPVLVDVETILSPRVRDSRLEAQALAEVRARLADSVLSTYLLPSWSRSSDGEVYDGSGFGAGTGEVDALTGPRWVDVGTDRIRLERGPLLRSAPRAALPDGRALRVWEYEADLVRGFVDTCEALRRERAALLADGARWGVAAAEIRFVYRNTSVYNAFLAGLRAPRLLREGIDRSLEVERLAPASVAGAILDGCEGWGRIFASERDAVERGDVPWFGVRADENDLRLPEGGHLTDWFTLSGLAAFERRLVGLDEAHVSTQVDLIRSAIRARVPEPPLERGGTPVPLPKGRRRPDLLGEAVRLARMLGRGAVRGDDGSVTWVQPMWTRQAIEAGAQGSGGLIGHDLYAGAAGVALFLSAVVFATGESDLVPLALGALRPVIVELEQWPEQTADALGIGGLAGLSSVVYALVEVSRLLEKPALLGPARLAASLVGTRIGGDINLDLALGSAGALLALLAAAAAGDRSAIPAAQRCGARLLEHLEPIGGGRAVRTPDGRFLCGLAHGAAGVALALDRLHAATGATRWRAGADALITFERSSVDPNSGDWPDRRKGGGSGPVCAWCHGAPGIAIARAAVANRLAEPETRREVERALALTLRRGLKPRDHLCCGTAGTVEVLNTLSLVLDRAALHDRAAGLAAEMVARANVRGGYTVAVPAAGRLSASGLFQGIAGVGFSLLRLCRPHGLPEPLLLR